MATTIDVGDWLSAERPCTPGQRCGLFVAGNAAKSLPLRARAVSATVYAEHGFCEVQEQLTYVCDEDCTVRFVFPLPPRSGVYRFEATIGDRKVVTEVKRKAVAKEEYDSAVRQGHSAVHMAQQAGASLYSVEVGNLCAMEEAIITFCYVRLLNSVAGAVEFEHQATWVPPYLKASELDATGTPTKEVASANPVFADKVSYKLSYRIQVQSSRGFKAIESPTSLTISEDGPHRRMITLEEAVSDPSRDLTLLVELPALSADQSYTGQLLLQECDRQAGKKHKTVALATFIPRLHKTQAEAAQHAPREIVFVVDGSGSMGGSPIQQALEAALFFVKDLPTSGAITFNAAMFGSGHQLMWTASKPYTQASQQEATKWLQANVNANWGGTEVLSVLKAIYDMPLPKNAGDAPAASRQIIFLTDGGVSGGEEAAIYDLVQGKSGSAAAKAAAAHTSIYSLGIGHGVHRGLVEGVATKTGGMAQFVVDGEAIGKKAGLLKRCALAAQGSCLTKPRLVTRSCMVKAAPNVLPPRLFPDEPLHMLVQVVKSEPGASLELTATIPGATAGGDSSYSISLPLDKAVRVPGDAFAVLHAMCSIGGLLGGTSELHCRTDGTLLPNEPSDRQLEDAVVALAEEEGLVTPHTSAVGVLLQQDPLDPDSVRSVEVPLQVPAGRDLWKAGQQQQQQMYIGCAPGGGGISLRGCSVTLASQCSGSVQMLQCKKISKGGWLSSLASSFTSSRKSVPKPCAAPAPALMPMAASYAMAAPPPPGGACFADAAAPACKAAPCRSKVVDLLSADDEESEADLSCEMEEERSITKECRQERKRDRSCRRSISRPGTGNSVGSVSVLAPDQVLSLLNLRRTAQGNVAVSDKVLQALAGQAYKQQQEAGSAAPTLPLVEAGAALLTASVRPAALASDEVWVTLLALAYLRKYLASEQGVWSGLEAKALEWLATVWPADAGRSPGSLVLAAMKLV